MMSIADFENDQEYRDFEMWIDDQNKARATAKSYRTTFRKLRNILGKNIRDTAQETVIKAVIAAIENVNSQAALLNVAIILREQVYQMPANELIEQRALNKGTIVEALKMTNMFIVLPSLDDFDAYLETLWKEYRLKEYIINYLIRHHCVRNQDLIFHVVERKSDTTDETKNYMWIDRKKQRCVFIRNVYKTSGTYGQKQAILTNERFLAALKKTKSMWPLTEDQFKIGYYIQKFSYNQLGESNLLKIIINHYKGDISKLKEISESRGTDLNTLLTSYNVNYTD